jgi:hypothetical protein
MKNQKIILIDAELHQKIKVYCAEHGIKLRDYIQKIILENMEAKNELN